MTLPAVEVRPKPPSVEQLEQIRRLSDVMYGNPGLAFKKHGMPESRFEAAALLRRLNEIRGSGDDEPEAREEADVADTKTCTKCGEEKDLDEFYKGHGKCKPCFKEHQKQREAKKRRRPASKKNSPRGPAETIPALSSQPDPPLSTDGWHVFTDPRLSDLHKLQEILAQTNECDLEEAARVALAIAETFRPKGDDDR